MDYIVLVGIYGRYLICLDEIAEDLNTNAVMICKLMPDSTVIMQLILSWEIWYVVHVPMTAYNCCINMAVCDTKGRCILTWYKDVNGFNRIF